MLGLNKQSMFSVGRIVLGVAASVGLGWLAVRGLDWDLVSDSLSGVSAELIALSIVVFMFASWLRAYRWKILLRDEAVSTGRLFVIQNEGIGLNNLVPVRIASEATQLAVLTMRDRVRGSVALATLGMERVVDVVASTLILIAAFFFVPEMENFTLYVWGALGFAVVAVVLVRFLSWGSDSLQVFRRWSYVQEFATAVRDLERARMRLAASLAVSTAYWILVGMTAWIIAQAIDMDISPVTATIAIMGTIFFATAVPALPSSVGTFEAAVVYVLDFFGMDRSSGFAFAILIHAVLFLPPTIIAVVMLPREGIVTFGQFRRLFGWAARPASGSGS